MSKRGAYCFLEKMGIRQVLSYSNPGEMSEKF
jgi:hypothetical protein